MENSAVADRTSSVSIPTWAIFNPGLDPGAFRTWCALAAYVRRGATPLVEELAAELQIHRTTMFRHLDDLEARGLIRRHRDRYWCDAGKPGTSYELASAEPLAEAS